MNPQTALAVTLAVLSAACYAGGALGQQRVAQRGPTGTGWWWLAAGGNVLGALLHVLALRFGPLTVVQPLGALTLVFALPVAAWAAGRRVRSAELLGAGLTVAGLGVLLSLVPGNAGAGILAVGQLTTLVTAVVLAAGAAVWLGHTAHRPGSRAAGYGAAAGVSFALASVLTQSVAVRVADAGLGGLLSPVTAMLAAAAVAGVLLSQAAYRATALAVPLTAVTLANPVAAAVIGLVLLGETFAGGVAGGALAVLAAALTIRGVVLLAGDPAPGQAERVAHRRTGQPPTVRCSHAGRRRAGHEHPASRPAGPRPRRRHETRAVRRAPARAARWGRRRVNRGEIWTIGDRGDLRYRVLVLSADAHNDRRNAAPFCAPIVRQRGSTDLPPFAVPLTEQDPITGVVVVNRMRRLPASVGAERIGMVTGASMARLVAALRDLFEL